MRVHGMPSSTTIASRGSCLGRTPRLFEGIGLTIALSEINGFLIDMDGVLYRGDEALPGMQDFLTHLVAHEVPHAFITNNSGRTPTEYAQKLIGMGAPADAQRVLTSSLVTAAHLAATSNANDRIFMIGGTGLRHALDDAGLARTEDPNEATVVVVGIDRELTYEKLARATLAVGRGARFLGTNGDRSFPSERGNEPGAGALLAAIETACGVKPRVFGKPQPDLFQQGLRMLGTRAERTAMIGDRYETDIIGAHHVGLVTIAVTSGIGNETDLRQRDPAPDFIFPSVLELWRAL
jgi:4-nitrophenyl phosphatase